jgi:hypothetical protein
MLLAVIYTYHISAAHPIKFFLIEKWGWVGVPRCDTVTLPYRCRTGSSGTGWPGLWPALARAREGVPGTPSQPIKFLPNLTYPHKMGTPWVPRYFQIFSAFEPQREMGTPALPRPVQIRKKFEIRGGGQGSVGRISNQTSKKFEVTDTQVLGAQYEYPHSYHH